MSVVGLKSLDVSPYGELLLLPVIIKKLFGLKILLRHLEFIIEQGHRVNWVSGSLDWIPGSLGRWVTKCDPVPSLLHSRRTQRETETAAAAYRDGA